MRGTRRSSIAGIAVAAAMALTLGACGGSTSAKSSPGATAPAKTTGNVLLASVEATTATKSAHISLSVTSSGPLAVNVKAEGDEDFTTGDAQMSMTFDGVLGSFLSGDFETRTVGGVMYMKLPDSIGRLLGGAGGGKWIKVDGASLGGGASGAALGQSDPTQALAYLEKASDDVKNLGAETVNGVSTTHYHATIDLGKSVDNAKVPPALREKVKQLWHRGGEAAPTIPADAWIDGEGRLVRMTTTVDTAAMVGGASGASGIGGALPTVTTTLNLSNFGEPVHVEAPPADQVIDLKGLGQTGGGLFGGLGGGSLGAPTNPPALKTS
jgi:hypothetical protein